MKHTKTYKLFSAFLAILMILLSFPCMAIEINNEEPQGEIFQEHDPVSENSEVYIIQEDTTKRGEFEKHYICSDGTYVVASYAEAIHYKDDHGEWVDVDNRPMQTTEGDYTTRNGDFGISIPSSADKGHLMRIDKGEHSLSWTLSANKKAGTLKMDSNVSTMVQKPVQSQKMQVSTTKRPEIITSNAGQPRENHKVLRDEATFDLPNVSGKVRYNNLFGTDEGVSVVYTTYRNKIEEDIYIEKPTDITSFSMEVEAPNLIPRLNADNSVDFLDNDGKMCYHVGIPYMMDADFVVLNDIETTVTSSEDAWVITYTPDAAWFTSEERVYPILLDPSITTNEYRTNIQDTYVEDGDSTIHSSEQLLYINGGTGNRKAVIRFVNLPTIDETMPLISAKMNFTAQYAPFSDVSLTLDYITGNRSISISAYTYENASKTADYSTYYILSPGLTGVSFNLTNYIYDILEGTGDFVLGYSADGDTTFCYPFHSAESTTGTGPVLTMTYGYSLPDGVADGAILALQNYGSTLFASVSGTNPAEYANVYQVERDDWIPTTNELFRLQYNAETGAYRLYSMASSSGTNRMLTVYTSTNGLIYGSKNVRLEDLDDNPEISQDWMIVSHDGSTFRLLPRSNMSVCLTANGDTEGTSSGTGTGTAGNVCVKTVDTNSDYQLWWLVNNEVDDNGNPLIYTSKYAPATLENGLYYFINRYSGRYLYLNRNAAMSTRGVITDTRTNDNVSDTSETSYQVYRGYITWRITNLGDGYCTIQNPISMNYLYAQTDTEGAIHSNRYVKIGNMDESIPDNFKWRIYTAPGGGMIFKSKLGEYYLTLNETSLQTRNANIRLYGKYSSSSDNFGQQVWRVFQQEEYEEPTGRFTLSISALDIGESKKPSVDDTINSSLNDASDFYYYDLFADYGGSDAACVSFDHINGTISGLKSGSTTLIATHKTTGRTYPFAVKVNKNAIIIVPGIMGSELINANNEKVWMPIDDPKENNFENINIDAIANAAIQINSLECNYFGDSYNNIQADNNNFGTWDVYKFLYESLTRKYNEKFEILFFAYDWRSSNTVSAQKLYNFISDGKFDKVNFVAHSMGGLVVSSYIAQYESAQEKIDKTIFIGTPFEGSLDIVKLIINKNVDDILYNYVEENFEDTDEGCSKVEVLSLLLDLYNPIGRLAMTFPSIYELIPTQTYIETYEKPYLIIDTTIVKNELQLLYLSTDYYLSKNVTDFNEYLMTAAETFHESLYVNNYHVSTFVDSYYIVGTGKETITSLTYNTFNATDIKTTEGDGVVPLVSASLNEMFPEKTYYTNNCGHVALIANNNVFQLICNIIEDRPSQLPQQITQNT